LLRENRIYKEIQNALKAESGVKDSLAALSRYDQRHKLEFMPSPEQSKRLPNVRPTCISHASNGQGGSQGVTDPGGVLKSIRCHNRQQGFSKNLGLLDWKERPRWNPWITGDSIDIGRSFPRRLRILWPLRWQLRDP
jgi:hypothetical protein